MGLYRLSHLSFQRQLHLFQINHESLNLLSILPVTDFSRINLFVSEFLLDLAHLIPNVLCEKINYQSCQYVNEINQILSLEKSGSMSSQIIGFSHNSVNITRQKPFILQITNKSKTQSMIFKIKTTKQNTYQVKPPIGSIQPGDKKNIQFKLVRPLTEDEFQQTRKDKFQLQFLLASPSTVPKSKAQFKALWDQQKNDPAKQGNFVNFTFPVQSEGQNLKRLKTAGEEPFSPLKQKNGLLKSDVKNANIRKSFTLQGDPKTDQQMSKQFENLKRQESQLLDQRQRIFKNQPKATEKGSKSGVQIGLLVLAFLVSVMIGNFFKLRVFVQEQL